MLTKFWHWFTDHHDYQEVKSQFFPPIGRGGHARGFDMEEILFLHHGFTRIYYECYCGKRKHEDTLGRVEQEKD